MGNEVNTIQKVLVKDKETSKANGLANKANKSNISNNSNSDKKEYTYKELPKTGVSTTNSANNRHIDDYYRHSTHFCSQI